MFEKIKRWFRRNVTKNPLPKDLTFVEIKEREDADRNGKRPDWDEEEYWYETQ
jgi:hypothetical protein